MKILRCRYKNENHYAVLDGQEVKKLSGDMESGFETGKKLANINQIKLLAPVLPPNIIAIGLNYQKHAEESNSSMPERPVVFIKATTSLAGPEDNIKLPQTAPDEVDYEAELAVVIGRKAKNIAPKEVSDYIIGYTCANDVTARDCQQRLDKQWARAKSFDTFCPLGPWIETELDPDSCHIKSVLNGKVMQESNTSDMIFNVDDIVSYLSKNMTLLPGTVILTGTPEGVGFARDEPVFLESGDEIEIKIDGIGSLKNEVINED